MTSMKWDGFVPTLEMDPLANDLVVTLPHSVVKDGKIALLPSGEWLYLSSPRRSGEWDRSGTRLRTQQQCQNEPIGTIMQAASDMR